MLAVNSNFQKTIYRSMLCTVKMRAGTIAKWIQNPKSISKATSKFCLLLLANLLQSFFLQQPVVTEVCKMLRVVKLDLRSFHKSRNFFNLSVRHSYLFKSSLPEVINFISRFSWFMAHSLDFYPKLILKFYFRSRWN